MSQRRPTSFIDAPSIRESSSSPVVLFAATRWELAALRRAMPVEARIEIDGVRCFAGRHAGRTYWLVPTGIGPAAANAAANAVLNRHRPALAISAGFAGGLVSSVTVGDVIVATSVVSGRFDGSWTQAGEPVSCDAAVLRAVQDGAARAGLALRSGPTVSLATVLCRAVDKELISGQTGAIAVDMESAAIGKVANAQGVPFAVLRSISDVVSEDLPLDFNVWLKPWGWMRGIAAAIMSPSSLIGLNRLRRQSRLAAERLTILCTACAADGFGLSSISRVERA